MSQSRQVAGSLVCPSQRLLSVCRQEPIPRRWNCPPLETGIRSGGGAPPATSEPGNPLRFGVFRHDARPVPNALKGGNSAAGFRFVIDEPETAIAASCKLATTCGNSDRTISSDSHIISVADVLVSDKSPLPFAQAARVAPRLSFTLIPIDDMSPTASARVCQAPHDFAGDGGDLCRNRLAISSLRTPHPDVRSAATQQTRRVRIDGAFSVLRDLADIDTSTAHKPSHHVRRKCG